MKLNQYAKAIVGAVVAGLGALQVATQDGHITVNEWVGVASATVAALALVWGVQNAPAEPKPVEPVAPVAAVPPVV